METLTFTPARKDAFKTKSSARAAWYRFYKLNSNVLSRQEWHLGYKEVENGYIIVLTPLSGSIYVQGLENEDRALYRTKNDKKVGKVFHKEETVHVKHDEENLMEEIKSLKDELSRAHELIKYLAEDVHDEVSSRVDEDAEEEVISKSLIEVFYKIVHNSTFDEYKDELNKPRVRFVPSKPLQNNVTIDRSDLPF